MPPEEKVYTDEEAAQRAGVALETLHEWTAARLIEPSLLADGDRAFFDERDLARLEQLRRLHEIGYDLEEIRKIARMVGLPRSGSGRPAPRGARRHLTVGELAGRCGQNPRTIKYWEERGIIEPSHRSEGGFRLYDESYVLVCSLIHDLQLFGYTLEEIKDMAELLRVFTDMDRGRFGGTREEAEKRFDDMLAQLDTLGRRMDELSQGIERWRKIQKEKRAEILSLRKRFSRVKEAKAPTPKSRAAEESSS